MAKGKGKEKKTNSNFYLFLVFLSGLYAYLLVTWDAPPSLGLSIFFISLASLVFYLKTSKTLYTKIYYLFSVLFAFFLFYRANGLLSFFNFWATVFFGSMLILEGAQKYNPLNLVLSPLVALINTFTTKSKYEYYLDFSFISRQFDKKAKKIVNLLISIALTLLMLLIVLPLLSSANPIFEKLVDNAFKMFNLKFLADFIAKLVTGTNLIRIIFFFIFVLLLPKFATSIFLKKEISDKKLPLQIESYLIPKVVLAVVLIIFFFTQAQLYLATPAALKAMGVMHSERTREIFAHLTIVSFIIFGLLYNEEKRDKVSKTLTYLLLLEGLFLNMIAFKSDFDYSAAHGFTFKRLYGFFAVAWMLGIFAAFVYNLQKKLNKSIFVKNIVLYSGLILLIINVVNFDYLIFHMRKPTVNGKIDYEYLAFWLSPDSVSFKDQFNSMAKDLKNNLKAFTNKRDYTVLWNIQSLQNKYKKISWQAINLSEYKEYQKIKNVDVEKYRNLLNIIQTTGKPID